MTLTNPKMVTMLKRVKVIDPPSERPLTVEEVAAYLVIRLPLSTTKTEELEQLIDAATGEVERYLHRALITRTLLLTVDQLWVGGREPIWEGVMVGSMSSMVSTEPLELPQPPLQVIDEIRYTDYDNNNFQYADTNYFADNSTDDQYGRVVLSSGATVPANLRQYNAWTIQYKAGYSDTAEGIPPGIRQGMLRLIAYLHENKGDCIQGNPSLATLDPIQGSGAAGFLQGYRIERLET